MSINTAFLAVMLPLLLQVVAAQNTSLDLEVTGDCDVAPCPPATFCSSSGTCLERSCENYFQFGTGPFELDNTDGTELVCEDYTTGTQDNSHAVIYGCQGYGVGIELPQGVVSQVYNQKCTAIVKNKEFECYQLKPDTDFSSFLNQVIRITPAVCDANTASEVANGAAAFQSFIYQVTSVSPGLVVIHQKPPSTSIFDETSAFQTSHAIVSIIPTDAPTQSPTATPTTATPTTQSGGFSNFHGGIASVIAMTIFGILVI